MKKTIKAFAITVCISLLTFGYNAQTKLYSVDVTDQAITVSFPDVNSAQKVIDALARQGSYQPDTKLNAAQQEAAKRQFVADELTESISQILIQQRIADAANAAASKVDITDVPRKRGTPPPSRIR